VDWVVCTCHVFKSLWISLAVHVICLSHCGLGGLCMSFFHVSVDWVVCACHLFKSVWIGWSVDVTHLSQCVLGSLCMSPV